MRVCLAQITRIALIIYKVMIYKLSLKRGLPARTGFIIPFRGRRSLSFALTLRMLTEVRQSRYQPAADLPLLTPLSTVLGVSHIN